MRTKSEKLPLLNDYFYTRMEKQDDMYGWGPKVRLMLPNTFSIHQPSIISCDTWYSVILDLLSLQQKSSSNFLWVKVITFLTWKVLSFCAVWYSEILVFESRNEILYFCSDTEIRNFYTDGYIFEWYHDMTAINW